MGQQKRLLDDLDDEFTCTQCTGKKQGERHCDEVAKDAEQTYTCKSCYDSASQQTEFFCAQCKDKRTGKKYRDGFNKDGEWNQMWKCGRCYNSESEQTEFFCAQCKDNRTGKKYRDGFDKDGEWNQMWKCGRCYDSASQQTKFFCVKCKDERTGTRHRDGFDKDGKWNQKWKCGRCYQRETKDTKELHPVPQPVKKRATVKRATVVHPGSQMDDKKFFCVKCKDKRTGNKHRDGFNEDGKWNQKWKCDRCYKRETKDTKFFCVKCKDERKGNKYRDGFNEDGEWNQMWNCKSCYDSASKSGKRATEVHPVLQFDHRKFNGKLRSMLTEEMRHALDESRMQCVAESVELQQAYVKNMEAGMAAPRCNLVDGLDMDAIDAEIEEMLGTSECVSDGAGTLDQPLAEF